MAKPQDYSRVTIISRGRLAQVWIRHTDVESTLKGIQKKFGKRVFFSRPTQAVVAKKVQTKKAPEIVLAP